MKKTAAAALIALALAGCGAKKALVRPAGEADPPKPVVERVQPTSDDLMAIDDQARPQRSDEILRRSQKRQDDRFDLPPTS